MTERTTPVTVHLTDEQMDNIQDLFAKEGGYWFHQRLCIAIDQQRPRPITVGDQVRWTVSTGIYPVLAIHDGWAWLWYEAEKSRPYRSVPLMDLTRVHDDATT